MKFSEIHPFPRYVRFMPVSKKLSYQPFVPYDARLFMCFGGKGVITADGVDYTMERGSVIVINSGVPYHLVSGEKETLYFAVNFDFTFNNCHLVTPIPPEFIDLYDPNQLLEAVEFSDIPQFNRVVYLNGMTHLEKKCTAAEREYQRKLKLSEGVVSALMSEILFECARKLESVEPHFDSKLDEILDFIHSNYNKPLTNSELGKKFSFHPNYINELVRQSTGKPLHRYVLSVRLAKAIDLLEETDDSISDIAESCGFQSLYYFSRYFKNKIGINPTEYRRK